MMPSSENIPPASDTQAAGTRKPANQRGQPPEQPPLKCPRCDSSNTKFCYYNNYSLSQPRHFCKTCRRYWTKGGALRNVPIGGGCRKTKKLKPAAATTTSRLLSGLDPDFAPGFKFLSHPTNSSSTPAVEFQLGGLSLPRLHPATAGVYTQFVTGGPAGCFGLDLLGLNNNTTSSCGGVVNQDQHQINHISLSSIESLSSINQEMHWKLQQQRLALIYGNPTDGSDDHDQNNNNNNQKHQTAEKSSPTIGMNLFQNLEVNNNNHNHNHHDQKVIEARVNINGDQPTEWFFEQGNNNNYGPSNEIENGNWGDLHHFNGLQ